MIYSMTGYASVSEEMVDQLGRLMVVTVDLRSVNARFLDIAFRIPDECRVYEHVLREMIVKKLARGKLDLRIQVQHLAQVEQNQMLNEFALLQLRHLEDQVSQFFPDAVGLRVKDVLRWPGVLAEKGVDPLWIQEKTCGLLQQAIDQLLISRQREGERLATVLLSCIKQMMQSVQEIRPIVPELLEKQRQKLTQRLFEALTFSQPDSQVAVPLSPELAERVQQEVTLFGMRVDTIEELERLVAHLHETEVIIQQGGKVGKRLDFMMQELNREANTLGSKSVSKVLSDVSMALKLLIEQMREQVQNIE